MKHPRSLLARTSIVVVALYALTLCAACNSKQAAMPSQQSLTIGEQRLAIRGHQEIWTLPAEDQQTLKRSSPYVPWFIGDLTTFQLCIDAPKEIDTTRWMVSLVVNDQSAQDGGTSRAMSRMGAVTCYEGAFPSTTEDGLAEICASIKDAASTIATPCLLVLIQRNDPNYSTLISERNKVFQDSKIEDKPRALLQLAERAAVAGYSIFKLRTELSASYFLTQRGSKSDLLQVGDLLSAPPTWLASSVSHGLAGQFHYQQAMQYLQQDNLQQAWATMRHSEQRFRQVAHEQTIIAMTQRAQILMRSGASEEARQKLALAIEDCAAAQCQLRMLRNAKNALAWWLLQQPVLPVSQAQHTHTLLLEALQDTKGLERANVLVNLAYLDVRRAQDPSDNLDRADQLLKNREEARALELRDWMFYVQAVWAIERRDFSTALTRLDQVIEQENTNHLLAQALTSRAEVLRQQQKRSLAQEDLQRAALVFLTLSQFDQRVPLNPGQQAKVYFELARNALEMNDAQTAWSWLDQLDAIAANRACLENTDAAQQEKQQALIAQLEALNAPASRARQQQRQSIRNQLQDELQEILRSTQPCRQRALSNGEQFRAFVLDDEVIVLHRNEANVVRLEKRTPISQSELLERVSELSKLGEHGITSTDPSWRRVSAGLADILAPKPDTQLSEETRFVLYGLLQKIPIGALPYGQGWLSDVTTVILQPPLSANASTHDDFQSASSLFVVDPQSNLGGAQRSLVNYRRMVSDAQFLVGDDATTQGTRHAMRRATSLHVDGHASYNSAFPELSSLVMSDGELLVGALGQVAHLTLANLSACESGTWPVTASRGEFGLAGQFVSAGANWSIGTRTRVSDRLAHNFNSHFYKALQSNESIPRAYHRALTALKKEHSVGEWSTMILLGR